MLNLFPIQFLAPLAYTLLRLCVGVMLIRLGFRHIKHRNSGTLDMNTTVAPSSQFTLVGILELLSGTLIVFGAYTQAGALVSLFLASVQMVRPLRYAYLGYPTQIFFTLLFFASLSLFITGAGAFSFDLPI